MNLKFLENVNNKDLKPYYKEVEVLIDSVFNIKIDIKAPYIHNTIDIKDVKD